MHIQVPRSMLGESCKCVRSNPPNLKNAKNQKSGASNHIGPLLLSAFTRRRKRCRKKNCAFQISLARRFKSFVNIHLNCIITTPGPKSIRYRFKQRKIHLEQLQLLNWLKTKTLWGGVAVFIFSWFWSSFHYTSSFSSSWLILCSKILFSILKVEFKNKCADKGKGGKGGSLKTETFSCINSEHHWNSGGKSLLNIVFTPEIFWPQENLRA